MTEAFSTYSKDDRSAHLLIVGPDEEGLLPRIAEICQECINRVHFFDVTSAPEKYMSSADIFCLPSYREGFGTVLINAAAAGIPAIASRIYGSVEAVAEGVTGLLHEAGNIGELVEKMKQLGSDSALRLKMGENGLMRVKNDFSEATVTNALIEFYKTAFQNIGKLER